jgi:hypothetical protein
MAIDRSTHATYTSALNSYLTFCQLHGFNVEPTPHTLALYVTYQCTFINPSSVETYLSGICNQIESYFPTVRTARKSLLVSHALQGGKCRYGVLTHCKLPLTCIDLSSVLANQGAEPSHDTLLFTMQIFVGTDCLMCLAELVWPDSIALRDY